MVLGHLGVNVEDMETAKAYYGVLLPLVGYEPFVADADQFAFRPAGGKPGTYLFFYPASEVGPYSRHRVGLQHLAFMVKSRSAVHEVHRWVVQHHGVVLHKPQPFPRYPPPYFATFWLDPFGIMLEAVCHYDRE